MALAVDVVPHTFDILLLPAFPAINDRTSFRHGCSQGIKVCECDCGVSRCLRCVVVDPVDVPRDVAPLVGADDEALGRRGGGEQGHHAVAVVVLAVPQVVHVADVLGDDGPVLDEPVRLHREPVQEIPHQIQCPNRPKILRAR